MAQHSSRLSFPFLTTLAQALVGAAALAFAPVASAQDDDALEHHALQHLSAGQYPADSLLIEAEAPTHAVVIEGRVLDEDGEPAAGAVVVSSAGGKAVSKRDGSFRLEVARCPRGASLSITAVATLRGRTATSNLQVLPSVAGSTQVGAMALQATASCTPQWLPTFDSAPGMDFVVHALAVFDDGAGPALYAGGEFFTAGSVSANRIAKWDGSTWSALGEGMNNDVFALTVFDDGSGPALYAGGEFTTAGGVAANRLAKWNGSTWSAVSSGMDDIVWSLNVLDYGSGPALYAGGRFSTAGGVAASRIAMWNGSTWSALGSGTNGSVTATAVFDDGSGPALFAGGNFTTAGGTAANFIAKWNGSTWSPLGSGLNDFIRALAVFDDGSGPALVAGGVFTTAGGVAANRIAKWNGLSWSALTAPSSSTCCTSEIAALTVFDDGSGPALYAGGEFTALGGVVASRVAKWNGTSWSALGVGLAIGSVRALAVFDDGGGPAIHAGGYFQASGQIATPRIAKWDGSNWSRLGAGLNLSVAALTVFDDGSGPALYAGGRFQTAGAVLVNRVAKWNGSSWSALGSGLDWDVAALTVFDDGGGPALYAGGRFTTAGGVPASNIAKWNGTSWSALGSGITTTTGRVEALRVFDSGSGPALYAGGSFTAAGGVPASNIAKWDGTSWSALGSGLGSSFSTVYALEVFDDGSGPALYVGGSFTAAGGVPANNIAKWDGTSWSALGSGLSGTLSGTARALHVFDDGSGPALYVGGYFTSAGGVPADGIAKWDGSSWSLVGGGWAPGAPSTLGVFAFQVFDDGSGPALYFGGGFTTVGVVANRMMKWNGSARSELGSGTDNGVFALTVFDDGSGPALFVGGSFRISAAGDSYLAKWGCPAAPPTSSSYCTAGTTTNGCVPSISGLGTASASAGSGFTLGVANVEGQKSGLFFYGITGAHSSPWGSGSSFLCVKAPTQRLTSQNSGGTANTCSGALSEDWNAYLASHPSALGQPFAGGETVWAQAWFRDPPAPKTTNLSNGLEFLVAP